MRRILCFFLSTILFIGLLAQDNGGIYYNGEEIPNSRITGQKLGNLAGAYFSMGLSGAKRNLKIEGKTSMLQIKEKLPSFEVVFIEGDERHGGMFADEDNLDYLVMVKLKGDKNGRKMQTGSYGLTGVESDLSEKKVIALAIDELGNGRYKISPREELEKGEYCFWFNIKVPVGETEDDQELQLKPYNKVFDFTITVK